MIYDFGCGDTLMLAEKLLPALTGSGAVLLVVVGMSALAAFLQRRTVARATDFFFGWGIVAAVMTLSSALLPGSLPLTAALLAVFMLGATGRALKRGYFLSPFWLLAIFPGLVVMTAINLGGISGWDDFSHWVPNALYLFHFDGLPSHAMPPAHSVWPDYPYAVPFITYLASHLAGGFLLQGGAMFNFLVLMAFAAMLAQTRFYNLASLTTEETTRALNWKPAGLTGLALFLVTLANPGFNASFTMTNEGDTATMILVGVLALLLTKAITALKQKTELKTRDPAFQIASIAAALVLVKPVGFVLLGLLIFAFLVVALKNGVLKQALRQLPLMLAPAILLHFIWQLYVNKEMGGIGFNVLPLSLWHFDMMGSILHAMLAEAARKNGLFILTFFTIAAGTTGLFRHATPLRNYSLLAAIVCGGYIVFLFTCYVGSTFQEAEIRRAASFYRYATHIGMLGTTFLWLVLPRIWLSLKKHRRLPDFLLNGFASRPLAQKSCVLFAVSALPLALLVHGNWLVKGTTGQTCGYRETGREVAARLPDHSRLVVVDTESGGFARYVVNFELAVEEAENGASSAVTESIDKLDAPALSTLIKRFPEAENVHALLIQQPNDVLLLGQRQSWKIIGF
jgi:hypothetical protein